MVSLNWHKQKEKTLNDDGTERKQQSEMLGKNLGFGRNFARRTLEKLSSEGRICQKQTVCIFLPVCDVCIGECALYAKGRILTAIDGHSFAQNVPSSEIMHLAGTTRYQHSSITPRTIQSSPMPFNEAFDDPEFQKSKSPYPDLAHFVKTDDHVHISCSSPDGAVATSPPSLELSWRGITVHVQEQRSLWKRCFRSSSFPSYPRTILNNVHGLAKPGELLAIMGGSGAGKSCLLNVLAHRNLNNLQVQGTVRVNQQKVTKAFMRNACAYVQQYDCFVGSLTVKEHLMFNAILRMGKGYRTEAQLRKVEEVIEDLGLSGCADSLIGTRSIKGISGGEKKRLAFASEILTSPPILLCDEPTSGLDSFLAFQVVQVLKKLAATKSMTIVFTIHQPSSQVYELFDSVYMMAEGRLAFYGTREQAAEFWTGLGRPLPCNFNPSDHYISSLADESGTRKNTASAICDAYESSTLGSNLQAAVKQGDSFLGNLANLEKNIKTLDESASDSKTSASCFNQVRVLLWRNVMTILREPTLLKVQLTQSIFMSALTGVIYLNDSYTQEKVANINGSLFQMVSTMAFMFQFSVVHHFCSEIHTFFREYGSGLYNVSSYFIAKNLAELPNFTLSALLFGTILYWMSRLTPLWDTFLFYLLVAVLVQNTTISIGYAAGCIFGTMSTAVAVLPIFVTPMLAFGGYFINQATLPWFFYPFKYLSYFGYAFESLVVNEWSHVDAISGCTRPHGVGCYHNGTDVINRLSFSSDKMWFNVIILGVIIIAFRSIAFLGLFTRAKLRK
ncbi:unnamed protein product [Cylicocyclus nassatus]|uniref:ABC transporter domain-containing protein n=1 Tax=Cylicocyclus nassatus TaxID=53992 RepID=A0AA36M5G9_CYLNA|nr:unnamed protein product [Cylicocyclus nassatus]